jgi:hypothetical protein
MSHRTRLWLVIVAVTVASVIAFVCAQRDGERKRIACEALGGSSHWDRDGYRCLRKGQSLEVSP